MRRQLLQIISLLFVLAAIVTLVSSYQAAEHSSNLRVWFFDVGQGDATLIETPDREQILIDGGPDSSILQHLNRVMPLTDRDLDLLVISHNHSDHLAGINEVLRHYQVKEVWISGAIHTTNTYLSFLELINTKKIRTRPVTAGHTATYGDLTGLVLFPLESAVGTQPDNQHDASVITLWEYGQTTILMTGDAETEHEQALIQRNLIRPVTVLKVGHHGSKTSSSEAFLRKLQPELAVISVGANNRYGHPFPTTLERLNKMDIPVLRTDQRGTVRLEADLSSYWVATAK